MDIYYTNKTLYVDLLDGVNGEMVEKMNDRVFKILENYDINNIVINVLNNHNFDNKIFSGFKKNYYENYNGKLIIK